MSWITYLFKVWLDESKPLLDASFNVASSFSYISHNYQFIA